MEDFFLSLSPPPLPGIAPSASVLTRLDALLPGFRESERKIAEYVAANAAQIVHLSITELADRTDTSEATVIRFAQRLGYAGYAAFKIALALDLNSTAVPTPGELSSSSDVASAKTRVLQVAIDSINDTGQLLDDNTLVRAVDALLAARRIEVYGVGSSAAVAHYAYALLMQIGMPIVAITDPHLQLLSAVQLRPGDVAFAITVSGSTRDTVEALQAAKEAGATCICLTRYARAPITGVADVALLAAARPATFGGHQLTGRVAQIAVVDVLAAALALRRQEDSLRALARGRQALNASKKY